VGKCLSKHQKNKETLKILKNLWRNSVCVSGMSSHTWINKLQIHIECWVILLPTQFWFQHENLEIHYILSQNKKLQKSPLFNPANSQKIYSFFQNPKGLPESSHLGWRIEPTQLKQPTNLGIVRMFGTNQNLPSLGLGWWFGFLGTPYEGNLNYG